MNNKKIYKINDKINVEDLEEVAKGIVLKALKVIESSGNLWASRIIEKKDVETFEDLKQNVIVCLIENDYTIVKECYKIVNHCLYNYKVNKVKNIEILVNEDANTSNIDYISYINYIKEYKNGFMKEETKNKICLDALNLTEKQKEVLNIYSKLNSTRATAQVLGIAQKNVVKHLQLIRKKALKLCESVA